MKHCYTPSVNFHQDGVIPWVMFYWFNIISVPEVYKFIKTNKVVECKNLYIDCETKGFAEVFEFLMGEIFYLIV